MHRPLSALAPPFRPTVQPNADRGSARRAKPATQAVLNTVELMENVFAFLTPKQLITVSRVCKIFNTIVKTSPSVQQALFQRPDPKARHITWKWEGPRFVPDGEDARRYIKVNDGKAPRQDGERDIHYINPLVLTTECGDIWPFPGYLEATEETCVARFVSSSRFRSPGLLVVFGYGHMTLNSPADRIYVVGNRITDLADSAICCTMQLADPPVRKVVVEMVSEQKVPADCIRFGPVNTDSRRIQIERKAGVLFGDVVDIVKAESRHGPGAHGESTAAGNSRFNHIEFPDGFAVTGQEKESMQRREDKEKKIQQFRDEMALIACTRR